MAGRRWPAGTAVLLSVAWMALLAVLPWWLDLPLLLALTAGVVLLQHRLEHSHVAMVRLGLRWGLPGLLFALQRALGGDVFAWGAALLGALAGFTMLAGLDAWLDRDRRRVPVAVPTTSAEWPELAMAPIGPAAEIIELQPPLWQSAERALTDPRGQAPLYRDGSYGFADGSGVDGAGPHAAFSPAGRWIAARMEHDRGVVLWDRDRRRKHRLRGWHLCGWHDEQPWLNRREDDMPLALKAVLGQDAEG